MENNKDQNYDVNKIGIVYSDVKREYFPTEDQYITEKDALHEAEVTANEIKKLGIEPVLMPGNDTLIEEIKKHKPDLVFNLVNSINGQEYLTSTIPGILDTMGIPFTGAGLLGMAICCNKYLNKQLFQSARVPVPNFQLFHSASDPINPDMRFPLISKLNEIHGGVEMHESAVSENEKQFRERLSYLIKTYEQPVVVEEYIAGREITAYVLQGTNTKIYMAEKVFHKKDQKYIFLTFEDQWDESEDNDPFHYEKYEDSLLKEYVKRAFDVADLGGYAKFDIRLDASGRHFFVDSNANPAFGSVELQTAMGYIIQKLYGVSFQDILKRIINNTMGSAYFNENATSTTNGNGNYSPAFNGNYKK